MKVGGESLSSLRAARSLARLPAGLRQIDRRSHRIMHAEFRKATVARAFLEFGGATGLRSVAADLVGVVDLEAEVIDSEGHARPLPQDCECDVAVGKIERA